MDLSHCQHDKDDDPALDFEELLRCVICNASCKNMTSEARLCRESDRLPILAHRGCDRNSNEAGGVKSAFYDSW